MPEAAGAERFEILLETALRRAIKYIAAAPTGGCDRAQNKDRPVRQQRAGSHDCVYQQRWSDEIDLHQALGCGRSQNGAVAVIAEAGDQKHRVELSKVVQDATDNGFEFRPVQGR